MERVNPLHLNYAAPPAVDRSRPFAMIGIAVTTILAGPLVGVTTNAVNGLVSPTYFVSVMGWNLVSNVWLASIQQGIYEGTVCGFILSFILTLSVGLITQARCRYSILLKWLLILLLIGYMQWIVGGVLGMTFAAANPGAFQRMFIGVPGDYMQMLRYAWVGGSIWGSELCSLPLVAIGIITFWMRWKKRLREINAGLMKS
jgi:hypothetical protein